MALANIVQSLEPVTLKQFYDFDYKDSCRVATTTNGTLSSAFANGQTIDGVTLATGNRILIKNQTDSKKNGIYTVNATGAPTRAIDANSSSKVTSGLFTSVSEGTANADKSFVLTTNDAIVLDTTALAFAEITAGTADNSVTLAKMAGIARGKIIVGDASGDPSYLSAGANGKILVADANGDPSWTTMSGDATISAGALTLASSIDATKIANGTVTSAEFQHISTLSSNAQTQINSKVSQQAFESLEDEVGDLDGAKAPKASPTFTGVPAAPTAAAGTDTTQVATTAFVKAAIPSNLVGVNATAAELNILDETAVGTPGALAIEASAGDDGVLVYDNSANTISWKTLVTVCFLKGTKITLSDGQHKNIEEIKENDNLLSYRFHDLDNYNQDLEYLMNWYSKDYRGTNSDTLVKQLWENETTQYYIINDKLKVTPEHLLFIRRNGNYEWYPSKNVKKGYYLLTSENNFEEIVTIELVDEKTKVYNLKLQGIMNYYASDYLVHCSSKCDECENNK